MQEKSDKMVAYIQGRYKSYHDCRVSATTTFRPGQVINGDCPKLAVTAADQLAADSYSKLLT